MCLQYIRLVGVDLDHPPGVLIINSIGGDIVVITIIDSQQIQAIIMNIYRTLLRRGLHPLEVLTDTLRSYDSTGSLQPYRTELRLADDLH